jgi:hypothetical protein
MRTFVTTAAFVAVITIIYAAAATRAQTVVVSGSTCAALARYVPDPSVDYKPGMDADGQPVAPADLGGGVRIDLPKEFQIPITVDLQKRLGIPVDPNQYQTDQFRIGTVTYKDGRAYFNGQPLQDEAAAELSALCQQQMQARR